jgi:hypothetical protein
MRYILAPGLGLHHAIQKSLVERLKAMVISGASAFRASIALKCSLAVTKRKAKQLGYPFRTEAELRSERRRIFEDSASA